MKLLLRLWLLRQRREFKWSKLFGAVYVYSFMAMGTVLSVMTSAADLGSATAKADWAVAAAVMAVAMIPADTMVKLFMKHDTAVMDDCLRTKPVGEATWNRFIAVTNLFNFWNFALLIILVPLSFWLMPPAVAALASVAFYAISYTDGLAVTALRKARGWEYRLPVAMGWMFWGGVLTLYAINLFRIPWAAHLAGFAVLSAVASLAVYLYMCRLHTYHEDRRRTHRVMGLGWLSVFRMEMAGILRARRLRMTVLVMLVVMPLEVYYLALLDNGSGDMALLIPLVLYMAVEGASMAMGGMMFGVEANYFDGLMTKPYAVGTMLQRKYYAFALLNAVGMTILLPLTFLTDLVGTWHLLALWLFASGAGNLTYLPTCLKSNRIDIFASAFFNYQGASWSPLGFLSLIPFAGYVACAVFLPPVWCTLVLATVGLAGLALHRRVIGTVEAAFMARRYERMESYRN